MDHPMDNDVNEENEPVSKFTTLPERITIRLNKQLMQGEILRDAPKEVRLLNGMDISIVNAMLYQDPLTMSINNMAQKLGIPARTLRRRVEKLLEDGVVYEEVSLDTNKSRGVMITSVIMKGDLHHWLPLFPRSYRPT